MDNLLDLLYIPRVDTSYSTYVNNLIDLLHVSKVNNSYSNYKLRTEFKQKQYGKYTIYAYEDTANVDSILFLSGGCELVFNSCVKKFCDELIINHEINKKYNIYVFENTSTLNILCVDQIKEFCKTLYNVIILGFSNGGVIGSHVATSLTNCNLICYNSGFDIVKSIEQMHETNSVFRIEIYQYYSKIYLNACRNCNPNISLFEFFQLYNTKNIGLFVNKYYGITAEQYRNLMRMQFPNCEMHCIHAINDPIVLFSNNLRMFEEMPKNITCDIHHHFQSEVAHCTSIGENSEKTCNLLLGIINKFA
jgi:hypothetical protein